jgi:hypothetical protein
MLAMRGGKEPDAWHAEAIELSIIERAGNGAYRVDRNVRDKSDPQLVVAPFASQLSDCTLRVR